MFFGNSKGRVKLIVLSTRLTLLCCIWGLLLTAKHWSKLLPDNADLRSRTQHSTFISIFNQLYAQNLFHSKFYFMPLHVLSTCAHHQEVKIALHSLWYHHTYRWPSRARNDTRGCVIQF